MMIKFFNCLDAVWSVLCAAVLGVLVNQFSSWAVLYNKQVTVQTLIANSVESKVYTALSNERGTFELPQNYGLVITSPVWAENRHSLDLPYILPKGVYNYELVTEYHSDNGKIERVVVPLFQVKIND